MEKFKPMTIVFKVSDNIKQMMLKHYEDLKYPKTPPYALFQVKDIDCVTTLYESGKVVFQGIGADIEASYWIEQERILNHRTISIDGVEKKKTDEKKVFINESSVGSDEVGTGDYFGPLVVTAAFVDKSKFMFLQELGVRDSKKLTDEKIISIAPKIIKEIPHSTIVLSNGEYNKYYGSDTNMNKIKAILHNKCLLKVLKMDNINYSKIVVDQFEAPKNYYAHLNSVPEKVTGITFMTKAEDQCFSVAVASIISRFIFLKEMKQMSERLNISLPLGASELVDEVGANLVNKYGKDILKEVAKMNFKNTDKIFAIIEKRN